jgi:hypothetical protein
VQVRHGEGVAKDAALIPKLARRVSFKLASNMKAMHSDDFGQFADADEGRSMTAAQTKKRNVLVIEDEPIHRGLHPGRGRCDASHAALTAAA